MLKTFQDRPNHLKAVYTRNDHDIYVTQYTISESTQTSIETRSTTINHLILGYKSIMVDIIIRYNEYGKCFCDVLFLSWIIS